MRDDDVCAVVRCKALIAAEEGSDAGFHRCSGRGRAKATSGDDRSEHPPPPRTRQEVRGRVLPNTISSRI